MKQFAPLTLLAMALALPAFAQDARVPEQADTPRPSPISRAYNAMIQTNVNTVAEMGAIAATDRWVRIKLGDVLKADMITDAQRERFIGETENTVETVDKINTSRLKALLEDHDWADLYKLDPMLADSMLTIVNHAAHDNEFRRQVLDDIEPLVADGTVEKSRYATSLDKVLLATDAPQIYGTQVDCMDGEWAAINVEDTDTLDDVRATMDLIPIDDYLVTIVGLYGTCPAPDDTDSGDEADDAQEDDDDTSE